MSWTVTGKPHADTVLTATRGGAAWECLGHAVAAYEAAVRYAGERQQFGKPIASFQLVQSALAGMLAEITAMQLICFRVAELQTQGRLTGPMAYMAKMHNARKARVSSPRRLVTYTSTPIAQTTIAIPSAAGT